MEGHWVDFAGVGLNGKDCPKGIVRSVCFNNDRTVRNPMSENRSGGEGGLDRDGIWDGDVNPKGLRSRQFTGMKKCCRVD